MSSPGAENQHLRGQRIRSGFCFIFFGHCKKDHFILPEANQRRSEKQGGSFGNYPEKIQQITQNALQVTEKEASQLTSKTRGIGKRKMTNTYLLVRLLCLRAFSLLYRIS